MTNMIYPYTDIEYINIIDSIQPFRDQLNTKDYVIGHGIIAKNGYYQLLVHVRYIADTDKIPKIVDGVEIIVDAIGDITPAWASIDLEAFKCNQLYEDLVLGICINNFRISGYAGTLGAITKKDTKDVILSNCHVIGSQFPGDYTGQIGDGIYAPPKGITTERKVGTLAGYQKVLDKTNPSNVNYIDAAYSNIDSGINYSNTDRLDKYTLSGTIVKGTDLALNTPVMKTGARTGYTKGEITSIDYNVTVDFNKSGMSTDAKKGLFKDQIYIEGTPDMMGGGDSGSVWVRESDSRPIALNFAGPSGNTKVAIANKLERVENELDISFGIEKCPLSIQFVLQ